MSELKNEIPKAESEHDTEAGISRKQESENLVASSPDIKKRFQFTFQNFAKVICKRQNKKKADTFIIIYGLPRTGKTTLGFNILFPFLKLKRKLRRLGVSEWEIERGWKKLFRKYFATSCEDMGKKAKFNPPGSFTFVDEGLDIVSWHQRLTMEQKDLLELLQKTGKRHQLTVLITPSLSLLTKDILARAHYLFIILSEPGENGNDAYLFKNYTIPFMAEKFPFGLKKIEHDLEKFPFLSADRGSFLKYLKDRKRFMGVVKFGNIDKELYELYDKLVKEPSIMRDKRKRKMISFPRWQKLRFMFDTIVYNLYTKDNKTVTQIENLMTDKFGFTLANRELIKTHLNRMSMLEVRPDLDEKEEIIEPEIKDEEIQDITVDDLDEDEESYDGSNGKGS
jgi:hypothetical protein